MSAAPAPPTARRRRAARRPRLDFEVPDHGLQPAAVARLPRDRVGLDARAVRPTARRCLRADSTPARSRSAGPFSLDHVFPMWSGATPRPAALRSPPRPLAGRTRRGRLSLSDDEFTILSLARGRMRRSSSAKAGPHRRAPEHVWRRADVEAHPRRAPSIRFFMAISMPISPADHEAAAPRCAGVAVTGPGFCSSRPLEPRAAWPIRTNGCVLSRRHWIHVLGLDVAPEVRTVQPCGARVDRSTDVRPLTSELVALVVSPLIATTSSRAAKSACRARIARPQAWENQRLEFIRSRSVAPAPRGARRRPGRGPLPTPLRPQLGRGGHLAALRR